MADTWENAVARPGQDFTSVPPWEDPDGDGWTNFEEYLNFTDPNLGNDPLSREFHVPPSP